MRTKSNGWGCCEFLRTNCVLEVSRHQFCAASCFEANHDGKPKRLLADRKGRLRRANTVGIDLTGSIIVFWNTSAPTPRAARGRLPSSNLAASCLSREVTSPVTLQARHLASLQEPTKSLSTDIKYATLQQYSVKRKLSEEEPCCDSSILPTAALPKPGSFATWYKATSGGQPPPPLPI